MIKSLALRAPARETPAATAWPAEPDERIGRPTGPAEKETERSPQGSSSAAPRRDIIGLLTPAREMPPAAERPAPPAAQAEKPSQNPRKGWLRRHPVLAPVGLMALLPGAAVGYLCWIILRISSRRTTPSSRPASSRSRPRSRATLRRSRSPTTSMSTRAA
jgi:hypothetical protein